ncbi:response regulator transcription factor [Akkermansiaceae bacterium]|jgi:DNA-binding response OmpR family regulator|nr:response regulator transcription factor [Akkermansiaceae bacterium]
MRILVLEDYPPLRSSIVECLTEEGYAVDSTDSGDEGLWFVRNHEYDVALLDIMVPEVSGLEIVKKLRTDGNLVSVIIISARDTVDQKIEGLESGADDYLVKPFSLDEMLARVRVQIRRRHEKKSPLITISDLVIDTSTKAVQRAGKTIDLTRKEYLLLECLAYRNGEVLSREDIARQVYQDYDGGTSNVVDVYIGYLRKKLHVEGLPNLIHTKRGHGYLLSEL